jgi:hypothetical protein
VPCSTDCFLMLLTSIHFITMQPLATRKFTWYTGPHTSREGDLVASPDLCTNGNSGIRAIDFYQCAEICLWIANCKVVAFFPRWYQGPSACFAMDQTMIPKLRGSTSGEPVANKDQNSDWGLRQE